MQADPKTIVGNALTEIEELFLHCENTHTALAMGCLRHVKEYLLTDNIKKNAGMFTSLLYLE